MKILILVTNAAKLTLKDGEKAPSGFWAEEFAVPYQKFIEVGYQVDVATVGGISPTPDASSLAPETQPWVRPPGTYEDDVGKTEEYKKIIETAKELKNPLDVAKITKEQVAKYRGVYYAGGHGCMEDMPKSQAMGNVAKWANELNIPIAAVCHGHCGLLTAKDDKGEWLFKGYNLTCFSHDEEKATRLYDRIPFVLQEELENLGANYSKSPVIWGSHIVEDRNLITGQNPYSSEQLADVFLKRLSKQSR